MTPILRISLLCLLPFISSAQNDIAINILKEVDQSVSKNSTLQYDYTYEGWGKSFGQFKGHVKISRVSGLDLLVSLKTIDKWGNTIRDEQIYTNGDSLKLLDRTSEIFKVGTARMGSSYLMSYAWYAVFRESIMPNPFKMSLNDSTIRYEGETMVGEIPCHIISMQSPWGDRNHWYFGKEDYQIYGQRQVNDQTGTEGGFEFKMFNVQIDKTITLKEFQIDADGMRMVNEDERLIGVGKPAPEWLLKNAAKENVSSRDLKGKVILLDFWASWCAPCWQIMPVINKVSEEFNDSELFVFGVNVWENPTLDIDSYLQKKNLDHYRVLFDRDAAVAKSFKIAALPLVVIIDQEGKIIYLNNGVEANMADKITEILRSQLD